MKTTTLQGRNIILIGLVAFTGLPAASDKNSPAEARREEGVVSNVQRKIEHRLPEMRDRILVENRNGHIVLNGIVDMPLKKDIAGEAAESVRGVQSVVNRIEVRPEETPDERLAREVEAALRHDPATMAFNFEASARGGVVMLHGTVEIESTKRLAAWVASGVRGVREIKNDIVVRGAARSDAEIREELVRSFESNPLFNDDSIRVSVQGGVVTLSGEVDTALEKTWVRQDAWLAGVHRVDNGALRVNPESAGTSQIERPPPTDADVRRAIERALAFDPRVRSFGVEAAVLEGVATLRGTVSNRRAEQAALELARHTGGVREVVNAIEVRSHPSRSDPQILADLKAALERSAALANDRVDVTVSNGRVVLSGNVDSAFEKWSAEDYADRTAGVIAVDNTLIVAAPAVAVGSQYYHYPSRSAQTPWIHTPGANAPKSDDALVDAVTRKLEENALTSPGDIDVSARQGAITLEGSVGSWSARGLAANLAYEAGARTVHNQLQVRYPGR